MGRGVHSSVDKVCLAQVETGVPRGKSVLPGLLRLLPLSPVVLGQCQGRASSPLAASGPASGDETPLSPPRLCSGCTCVWELHQALPGYRLLHAPGKQEVLPTGQPFFSSETQLTTLKPRSQRWSPLDLTVLGPRRDRSSRLWCTLGSYLNHQRTRSEVVLHPFSPDHIFIFNF